MPGEVLEWLAVRADGVYLDCTTGLGGHTRLIAEQLTTGVVIANDRDYVGDKVNSRVTNLLASLYLVLIMIVAVAAIPLMIVTRVGA